MSISYLGLLLRLLPIMPDADGYPALTRFAPPVSRDWTMAGRRWTIRALMSVLFFKRFLQKPFQIASIVPSSKALVERVADKIDFDRARVIAEYGPGEGVHSRAIARRMSPDARRSRAPQRRR